MSERGTWGVGFPLRDMRIVAGLLAVALLAGCQADRLEFESNNGQGTVKVRSEGAAAAAGSPPAAEVDAGGSAVSDDGIETATLGAGCYWCVEAVLEQLEGVESVVSGFMGGDVDEPSYEEVCLGTTGHAEVVQVRFDPKTIAFDTILDWFFKLHDPTTLNRQGNDAGTQYRSVIFWHDEAQRAAAERAIERHQKDWADPIVTEIAEADTFYVAPEKHQEYYRNNREAGYCRYVIKPKLDKLDLDS